MQMKDVIREKRKECGLTQEQMARYLGVSAPAVNKWESGSTYPDITLLSALARLLGTDVNTLLGFRENLTTEDIVRYMAEITDTARKEGTEQAVAKIRELVKEYPSCAELLHQMASLLTGMAMLIPCTPEETQKNHELAAELYERVAASDDPTYAHRARFMMASRKIQQEEYDSAQELIDQIPAYDGLDKRQLQIMLYIKQNRTEEAGKLLEKKLNSLLQEVYLQLNYLATVAVREKDDERAWKLAEYAREVMAIYGWDYSKYAVEFSVAQEEKDAGRCLDILEKMLDSLEKPVDMTDSVLFTHIRKEKEQKETSETAGTVAAGSQTARQICSALLSALENDEEFAFLREKPEYGRLMERYKK